MATTRRQLTKPYWSTHRRRWVVTERRGSMVLHHEGHTVEEARCVAGLRSKPETRAR